MNAMAVMDEAISTMYRDSYSAIPDDLAKVRAAFAELIEAVRERREMSRANGHSTGPYAASDARIDAALAIVGGDA